LTRPSALFLQDTHLVVSQLQYLYILYYLKQFTLDSVIEINLYSRQESNLKNWLIDPELLLKQF